MVKTGLFISLALLILLPGVQGQSPSHTWKEVKEKGEGSLVIAFSENSPFVSQNAQGQLSGIEYEIMEEFVKFVEESHGVTLILEYEHLYDFESLLDTLRSTQRPLIGMASISSLEERKQDFYITKPYMPDIEMVVSSREIGPASSLSEFADMVKHNRAITVSNSTFERNILELKQKYFPEIQIEYSRHVDFLIKEISDADDAWGYISLPNYLSYYREGRGLSRQRFFMVENPGLSLATTHHSGWGEILESFIADSRFQPLLDGLIEKHLGKAFGEVLASISNIEADLEPGIATNRELGVLMLEKEVQDLKLRQSELEIERKNLIIYLGIAALAFVLIALFFLYRLVRLKMQTNRSLSAKNEQIEAQIAELNALNTERNEMIGIITHDLKTPLTTALSVSKSFSKEDISDEQREYLEFITRSLNKVNSLVTDILEIKVLESPSLKTNFGLVDVKEVCGQVVSALKIQSDNKDIRILTELEEATAYLDRSLVVQIVDNLLSNAIKFSRHGSTVHVRLKQLKHVLRIEIADEGPGIREEDMPKLFQKFQKLHARPTGGESSTGLGLSIVKKYVEAMEGRVWCESEFGKGAAFVVEFKQQES